MESLWSGLIGSLIGILFSFGMFILKEIWETHCCIQAIKTEIKCLKDIVITRFDDEILSQNEILNLSVGERDED